jgi:hypothetical protein
MTSSNAILLKLQMIRNIDRCAVAGDLSGTLDHFL